MFRHRERLYKKREKALELALDVRKFEIELYWKRATYFWVFIGATFAAYVNIDSDTAQLKKDVPVFISCFGVVLSFAWILVNRGSKFWQENWEAHVDLIENKVVGPKYKTVYSSVPKSRFHPKHILVGSSLFSVSKINQLISIFVLLIWIGLLKFSLNPIDINLKIDITHSSAIAAMVTCCIILLVFGKSDIKDTEKEYSKNMREVSVKKED